MSSFFDAISTHSFLQNAILAGLLASISCGVVGSYVVVKRMSFISGGIAHAVLAGMGMAYFFGFNPLWGAVPAALLFALIIGWITLSGHAFEDTVIGALWATGMAVGILFIYKTPGYASDLFNYLFGNILMVTRTDVLVLLVLDVVILAIIFTFYKGFLAVCFDEEFARLQGVRVKTLYLTLLCLVALTVVLLVQIVGIVLVIALLTLPAAIARQWTSGLSRMMIMGSVCGLVFTMSGLTVSYAADLPGGAPIVLAAGLGFLLSTAAYSILRSCRSRGGT